MFPGVDPREVFLVRLATYPNSQLYEGLTQEVVLKADPESLRLLLNEAYHEHRPIVRYLNQVEDHYEGIRRVNRGFLELDLTTFQVIPRSAYRRGVLRRPPFRFRQLSPSLYEVAVALDLVDNGQGRIAFAQAQALRFALSGTAPLNRAYFTLIRSEAKLVEVQWAQKFFQDEKAFQKARAALADSISLPALFQREAEAALAAGRARGLAMPAVFRRFLVGVGTVLDNQRLGLVITAAAFVLVIGAREVWESRSEGLIL